MLIIRYVKYLQKGFCQEMLTVLVRMAEFCTDLLSTVISG